MEYTGFIQDLLTRSDELLRRGRGQKREATMLLMLLSCGFVIPYERLKHWNVAGERSRFDDNSALRRFARRVKQGGMIASEEIDCFDAFGKHEWMHVRHPEFSFKGESFFDQILPRLRDEFYQRKPAPSLDAAMNIMRNALAHGGVHLVSPRQDRLTPLHTLPFGAAPSDREISHVYFVSEVTRGQGTEILRTSLASLEYFWTEWVKLMRSDREMLETVLNAA